MAIPFSLPQAEDDRLQALERVLFELMRLLNPHVPHHVNQNNTNRAGSMTSNMPPPPVAQPLLTPVAGRARRPPPLSNLGGVGKNVSPPPSPTWTSAPASPLGSPTTRQAWRQLGSELREIADAFSDKAAVENIEMPDSPVPCCGSPLTSSLALTSTIPQRPLSSLVDSLIHLLMPRTMSCSTLIILLGLRMIQRRFT